MGEPHVTLIPFKYIQYEKQFKLSLVLKVLYRTRTDQLLRTHVVPKGYFQNIVENISKNCNKDRISRTIWKSSLKESINKCFVKKVIKESNALCAENNNSFFCVKYKK